MYPSVGFSSPWPTLSFPDSFILLNQPFIHLFSFSRIAQVSNLLYSFAGKSAARDFVLYLSVPRKTSSLFSQRLYFFAAHFHLYGLSFPNVIILVLLTTLYYYHFLDFYFILLPIYYMFKRIPLKLGLFIILSYAILVLLLSQISPIL